MTRMFVVNSNNNSIVLRTCKILLIFLIEKQMRLNNSKRCLQFEKKYQIDFRVSVDKNIPNQEVFRVKPA